MVFGKKKKRAKREPGKGMETTFLHVYSSPCGRKISILNNPSLSLSSSGRPHIRPAMPGPLPTGHDEAAGRRRQSLSSREGRNLETASIWEDKRRRKKKEPLSPPSPLSSQKGKMNSAAAFSETVVKTWGRFGTWWALNYKEKEQTNWKGVWADGACEPTPLLTWHELGMGMPSCSNAFDRDWTGGAWLDAWHAWHFKHGGRRKEKTLLWQGWWGWNWAHLKQTCLPAAVTISSSHAMVTVCFLLFCIGISAKLW